MKIVQLTCVWPPYGGGIGRVALAYAKILSAEHQVTVLTPRYRRHQQAARLPGVLVDLVSPRLAYGNAAWLPQLPERLRKFDVVHLHYPFFGIQELLTWRPPSRLVVNYHMVPQTSNFKGWWFAIDCRWTERRLAPIAARWLVSSADYAEQLVRPRLGRVARLEVLPFGVAEQFKPGVKSSALLDQLTADHRPVLLFVGSLDRAHTFKGVEVLLRAAASLPQLAFKLVIVGGGRLLTYYQQQADNLGLGSKIAFAGQVTDELLPDYYRAADLFVLPSVNSAESFGLVIVEAMASGLPVVASSLPGVRSLVRPGATGWLCRPGDRQSLAQTLERALTNLDLAKRLGQRAAQVVDQYYRWSQIGPSLLNLYREL